MLPVIAPAIASALVGAGGSLLNSIVGSGANSAMSAKQRAWQTSEREASQQWQEDMWNKSNEYNSAKSQVARVLEAGLSPNLLYGSGQQVASGTASTPSAPTAPGTSSVGGFVPMDLTSLQNYYLKRQELANQQYHNETERMSVVNQKSGIDANARQNNALAESQEFFNKLNKENEKFLEIALQDNAYLTRAKRHGEELRNNVYELYGLQQAQKELDKLESEITKNASESNRNWSQVTLNLASADAQREMANELASQTHLNMAEASKCVEEVAQMMRTGDIEAYKALLNTYDGNILATCFKFMAEKARGENGQTTFRGHMVGAIQNMDSYRSRARSNVMPVRKRKR